ncbi:MAG: hypothetical protein ACUVTH_05820 [Thermogutta sp.]
MNDFNSDPQFEIDQLCPKITTVECLRAVLLFGLLFGMVALASLPEGTLPVVFLFAPGDSAKSKPITAANPRDHKPFGGRRSDEAAAFSPFNGREDQPTAQTVQATVATLHRPPEDLPNPSETRLPPPVGSLTSHELVIASPSNFAQRNAQPNLRRGSYANLASTEAYPPPLEGISQTGFTTAGYHAARRPGNDGIIDPSGIGITQIFIAPEQKVDGLVAAANPDFFGGMTNHKVDDLARQLQGLGAVRFRLETWGGHDQLYRFWCEMPLPNTPGNVCFFEAIAPQPEEAMENVMRQVQTWLKESSRPRP